MHDYSDEIEEAREYFEELRMRGREEIEAEFGPSEPIEADEDEAVAGLNQWGFRPYIAATGERIVFEAVPDDEMDPPTRAAAIRGDGWELWRQDADGQRWYVRSGITPPGMIHGTPETGLGGDYD